MTTKPLEYQGTAIRAIHRSDYEALTQLHQRVSEISLYWRYLSYTPPTPDELRAMCAAGSRGVVVLSGQQMIGFGYYVPRHHAAEMALLVADDYQRQGIGSRLFAEMVTRARNEGITTFEAIASADNRALMSLLRRSGLTFRSQFDCGFREIVIDLY